MTSRSKVVWLVDDDPEDQFLVQRAFNTIDPVVGIFVLEDGDEVIPALESSPLMPKLIILDINMVRMDGLQTLTALQEYAQFQTIPVVMLTTSNNSNEQVLSRQLGAKSYHTKPFHFEGLVELANQLTTQWLA